MTPLLSVENLTLDIYSSSILKGISFEINEGEFFGVIGESGSGKSLTAFSVMQLLPKGSRNTGRIMLDGVDLLTLGERQLCDYRGDEMSMVFQEPMTALNPVQTIGQQVAETVMIHKGVAKTEALKIARETLNRVELPAEQFPLDRYPHELSGGQRQRVVIALAIALRPKLLIADEPTTALDVTTQAQILDLLQRLVNEDGMSCMLITHDLGVVAGYADRVAIMKEGEIVERGETQTVFKAQVHPYTQKLFAASNHVPDRKALAEEDLATVLEVQNLIRDYPLPRKTPFAKRDYFRAVNEVSFSIFKGENLGLVGESGCGKSTLTRAVLGLDSFQGGSIRVRGQEIQAGRVPKQLRRQMQVVFQDPYGSFNPRHKVERLVAEPFHLLDAQPGKAEKKAKVVQALENVGMQASDTDKYIHEFSGGQRQRIAIARALILEPELIVLDEAVSALDVSIRAQILDLLAELSADLNLSYLFISHDLSVVRAITDRVMVMKAGEIVEQGKTDEVFYRPEHEYTKTLIAASPNLDNVFV